MARKKNGFTFVNMKPSLKKIEKDIQEIQSASGRAMYDVINLGQKIIQREKFIDGKSSTIDVTTRNGKTRRIYKEAPGANKLNKNNKRVFHKTKIVDRGGDLPRLFNQLNFKKFPGTSTTLYAAQNQGVFVKIIKDGKRIIAKYQLKGKYDRIFGIFHNGSRVERMVVNGKEVIKRDGTRPIIRLGLKTALRRWKNLSKFYVERAIKSRNKASKLEL